MPPSTSFAFSDRDKLYNKWQTDDGDDDGVFYKNNNEINYVFVCQSTKRNIISITGA